MDRKYLLGLALLPLLLAGCGTGPTGALEPVDTPTELVEFFDDDEDAVVERQEFDEEIDRFDTALAFDEIDANDDLAIDANEFAAVEDEFVGPAEPGLEDPVDPAVTEPFTFFDDDFDGFVEEEEFDEDIDRFDTDVGFDEIDDDDDLLVDEEEFGVVEDEFGI